jgi:phosphate transport system permease protein
MSSQLATAPEAGNELTDERAASTPMPMRRRQKLRTPLSAHGEPMVWLTGGALGICLVMVVGLLLFILVMGLKTFWPVPIERVEVMTAATDDDGNPTTVTRIYMGEVTRNEWYEPDPTMLEDEPPKLQARLRTAMDRHGGRLHRRLFRTGNYQLTNTHFHWVDDAAVIDDGRSVPKWAILIERVEWGRFYGEPKQFRVDDEVVATDHATVWEKFNEYHAKVRERWSKCEHLKKYDLGRTSRQRDHARLEVREVMLDAEISPAWGKAFREVVELEAEITDGRAGLESELQGAKRRLDRLEKSAGRPPETDVRRYRAALAEYRDTIAETEQRNQQIIQQIRSLNEQNQRYELVMETAQGQEKTIALDNIVRAYPANRLGFGDKLGVYLSRWWEFLTAEPREANQEGGVFPAIVGTVLMTLIMAILVVPFGVMAALYLREYAKGGLVVSAVRIAINNLAGVPSIVFGVFGLGFFCYGVGGFIDGGPQWKMPKGIWFVLLGVLAGVSAGAFVAMLRSLTKPGEPLGAVKRILRYVSGTLWLAAAIGGLALIATTPFFNGFFRANLPNPSFGKGALIWASFTLALLTLPVVIVATEEALAAVPNSMREGSYACGASKWQTIKRIVLPRAMPGIMTGTILAMARGAGEVAPLMLVGAVKLAPELPISWDPSESFGINRSFMHLGFHIYDLGFKSPNAEAARPLVFTTTLLLITIIAVLNLASIWLRSRLRRRFIGVQF